MTPIEKKILQVNQHRLQCYFWGNPQKPLILMVHGWMDSGASFHFLNEFLAKKFYCVSFDLRGYGKSQHTKNTLGYYFYDYIADLHEMIEKYFKKRKLILLGHSLGGAITSTYAGAFPQNIQKLINLEGFSFQFQNTKSITQRINMWLSQLENKKFKVYPTKAKLIERLQKANPQVPPQNIQWLSKYLCKKTSQGYILSSDPRHKSVEPHTFRKENFFEIWKEIKIPCLFAYAKKSELYQYYIQNHIKEDRKRFPKKTQLISFEKLGHMMHLENPKLVAEKLLNFL